MWKRSSRLCQLLWALQREIVKGLSPVFSMYKMGL